MIEETAIVVSTQGEYAWIEARQKSACGGCSAQGGCGTAVLSRVLGRRRNYVLASNGIRADVGDTVVVGIEERMLLRGSAALYAVPLIAMLSAALLGDILSGVWGMNSEMPAIVFGLAGLGGALMWAKRFGGRAGQDPRFQPKILRRVPSQQPLATAF